jgi:hypothetical protein
MKYGGTTQWQLLEYAESDGYLGKYSIVGLQENYISQNVLVDVQSNPIYAATLQFFRKKKKGFIQAVGQAVELFK